jgi:hypothetical protein
MDSHKAIASAKQREAFDLTIATPETGGCATSH